MSRAEEGEGGAETVGGNKGSGVQREATEGGGAGCEKEMGVGGMPGGEDGASEGDVGQDPSALIGVNSERST